MTVHPTQLTDNELLEAIRSQSTHITGDSLGRDATYGERFRALTEEAYARNLIGWRA